MNSFDTSALGSKDVGISTFLLSLYNNNDCTDILFTIKDGERESTFSAHRMVLAIWSSYFAEKFYGPNVKGDNVVTLLDINPDAFEAMLKYIYSSKIKIESPKKACEIYKVAKKFGIGSLMKECYRTLNKVDIKPENVLDMLLASDLMQNNSTKDRCIKVIQEKIEEVSETYQMPNIASSTINILIDSLNLCRGFNLKLFLWIFNWAKNRFVEDNTIESTRLVLDEFLPKLPFLCLSNVEFAELNRSYNNILEPDEVIRIFMNIAIPESRAMPIWYMAS